MIIRSAYCPHCKAVTNLFMQVSIKFTSEDGEKDRPITSRTYHCKSCNSFVRSEEDEPVSREKIKELF